MSSTLTPTAMETTYCKYCGIEINAANIAIHEEDYLDGWARVLCVKRKGFNPYCPDIEGFHEPEERIITLVRRYLKNHPDQAQQIVSDSKLKVKGFCA